MLVHIDEIIQLVLTTPQIQFHDFLSKYNVRTYTLDYLFDSGLVDKIDFMKMDIEGSEIKVLVGSEDAEGITQRDFNIKIQRYLEKSTVEKVNKHAATYMAAHGYLWVTLW